jgi:hypothetical protein
MGKVTGGDVIDDDVARSMISTVIKFPTAHRAGGFRTAKHLPRNRNNCVRVCVVCPSGIFGPTPAGRKAA